MTNREWLSNLSNVDLVYQFLEPCGMCVNAGKDCMGHSEMNCYDGCEKWLEQEHEGGENE